MQQNRYQACIDACAECANACDMCAAACLGEEMVGPLTRCIALDIDCAQYCRLAAGMMARESEATGLICRTCAELCTMCGQECARHRATHCQDCAAACRRCADACRQMGALAASGRSSSAGVTAH